MKINVFLNKLLKTKGIGYIAIALVAGIALLTLNIGESKEEPPKEDKNYMFVQETEAALNALGKSVCGVKCQSRVRISGGYTYSYACDQSIRTSYNPDGTVAEKETTLNNRTVNVSGGTALVSVKETPPAVVGVAMVCKNASVSDIISLKGMISALYGLEDNAIYVTN